MVVCACSKYSPFGMACWYETQMWLLLIPQTILFEWVTTVFGNRENVALHPGLTIYFEYMARYIEKEAFSLSKCSPEIQVSLSCHYSPLHFLPHQPYPGPDCHCQGLIPVFCRFLLATETCYSSLSRAITFCILNCYQTHEVNCLMK